MPAACNVSAPAPTATSAAAPAAAPVADTAPGPFEKQVRVILVAYKEAISAAATLMQDPQGENALSSEVKAADVQQQLQQQQVRQKRREQQQDRLGACLLKFDESCDAMHTQAERRKPPKRAWVATSEDSAVAAAKVSDRAEALSKFAAQLATSAVDHRQ